MAELVGEVKAEAAKVQLSTDSPVRQDDAFTGSILMSTSKCVTCGQIVTKANNGAECHLAESFSNQQHKFIIIVIDTLKRKYFTT